MKIVANHHEISFQQLPSLYLVEISKIFSSIPCPVLIKFQLRVLLFAENLHGRQQFLPHVKLSRHGDRRRRRSSPRWCSKHRAREVRAHFLRCVASSSFGWCRPRGKAIHHRATYQLSEARKDFLLKGFTSRGLVLILVVALLAAFVRVSAEH